jgi:hypothetical protein
MTQPYIFISHSSKDREFTRKLAASLDSTGFRSWVDLNDIPDGSTWSREIEKAVIACGAMLVIMSKHGRESEWVEREALLALELHKPLFVVRVDDTPLPIHLINRQVSDFRGNQEAALKKLTSALKKIKPGEAKKQSPEPNRLNFFKYVEQLPDGADNARTALALFDWAKANSDSITFSGRSEPALHANLWVGPGGVTLFSVRAYPRQPAVEVPLQFLMSFPPYDDRAERLRLLDALNKFLPAKEKFDASRADRRPNIPLIRLNDPKTLQAFLDLMGGIAKALRVNLPETASPL